MRDRHRPNNANARPRVVIIGAGFGGLYAARTLANKAVDVLLIDRNNYHTFTPLLYQVATCGLEPGEIAYPVRGIFRNTANLRFLLGEVVHIALDDRVVVVQTNTEQHRQAFDYLIVATGSVTSFFGVDQIAQHAFELKTLRDAVLLRNHILKLFEEAAWTNDPVRRQALTTFVVAGGGPTGLETAGALHELYNDVLQKEFPALNDMRAQVILVEAASELLSPFPQKLQQSALKQIRSLGIQPLLGKAVVSASASKIGLDDGQTIATHTLIWAAGVQASSLAALFDLPLQKGRRLPVQPTLEVVNQERIYAVGDIAYLEDAQARPYPSLIPVAKQQGICAARNILRQTSGDPQRPFRFRDRGIMATIGRRRAVAWIYNRVPLSGYLAWLAWLALHLVTLMGFRNRLNVFVNWVWNYLTYDRSVRIILEQRPHGQDREPE